jgi:uncharacterized protein (DUF1778 family)
MSAHSQREHERVKVTIECTADERAYIKMLAARAHLNLSEFILSYLRNDFPKKPNKETLEAHEEALRGDGTEYKSLDDFWEQMGIDPRAFD